VRGSIIVLKLPEMKEFVEINCGLSGIKKMVIDSYDSLLFAIGNDNSI